MFVLMLSGIKHAFQLLQGDGNVRYYEIIDEEPYICYLNEFISGNLNLYNQYTI